MLGIQDARAFGGVAEVDRLKLVFFAPPESVDALVDAISEAGAGIIGGVSPVAPFSRLEIGTFIGSETTNPTVGQPSHQELVSEVRVEMTLPSARRRQVERALLRAHPYEQPAYDFLVATALAEQPAGRGWPIDIPSLA